MLDSLDNSHDGGRTLLHLQIPQAIVEVLDWLHLGVWEMIAVVLLIWLHECCRESFSCSFVCPFHTVRGSKAGYALTRLRGLAGPGSPPC